MKKIININLSGRVIPIEDSAYEKLQAYIESLRRYFAHEDGRDEIINDIESRIAELMNDKVRKGAQAVTESDVDEIIASMGRPEDFDADGAEPGPGSAQSNQGQQQYDSAGPDIPRPRKTRSRLYRNGNDKFLGGVCSGIAAYLNIDPAIVRILFAIITFGGFGLGFLVYILLWIIIPSNDMEGYRGKRLYRNPDDKVLGGVAGGLAAYFRRETWLIRLIFAGPMVLSIMLSVLRGFMWNYHFDFFPNVFFGSLNGTLTLIYIVLWIVLPEARNNYEKMEMRGETVDVNSIRQNVKEEMDSMKDRMKDWGDELKESAQNFSQKAKEFANTRGKNFATEVTSMTSRGGAGIGHAIGVLFKAFFLFIAGTIAFALFVALIALLFSGAAWWPVNHFIWTSKAQQAYAWGVVIFFLAVPLVGLITWIVRRLLRVKSRNSYLGWTFGFLWTLGWISLFLLIPSISSDFRTRDSVEVPIRLDQPSTGKLIIAVSEGKLYNGSNFLWSHDTGSGFSLTDDSLKLSHINITFDKSPDSEYHVTLIKYAFGDRRAEAAARAEQVLYKVNSYDSILDIGNGFAIGSESKYRGQHVELAIQVPVGKRVRIDGSVRHKLNSVDIDWSRVGRFGSRRYGNDNWENHFYWESDVDYTMNADGNLVDGNGKPVTTRYRDRNLNRNRRDEGYRYRQEDLNDRERILREDEERLRNERQEIERLKKEQNREQNREPARDTSKESDLENESLASSGFEAGSVWSAPVNALVKFF